MQGVIRPGPRQLSLCIACNIATDIEPHVHTYAVGVADIAAREGSPHNVLHLSSSRRVSCWYVARTLLLNLCEQERSWQFGHFDCSILNFNCFVPHFALSMHVYSEVCY